jgi:hypothetical protein
MLPMPMMATVQIPIAIPAAWRRRSRKWFARRVFDAKIKMIQANRI